MISKPQKIPVGQTRDILVLVAREPQGVHAIIDTQRKKRSWQ